MSTDLTVLNTAGPSMTSKEVADLTGKRHDHVLRDIDALLKTLSPDLGTGFSMTYEGDPANGYRYFIMDRDSSYCLVAGYDANSRMRIIKRWQELEGMVSAPKPLTAAEHLRLTADMLERQAALEARVEAQDRQLKQIETASDHFTVLGWHRWAKLGGSLPLADAAAMGKVATKYCKDHDIAMGDVPDQRFGRVRTYPKWVLDNLFCGPAA